MAETAKYNFVVIDRDYTPDLAKKFNVSAYPSLIVLGKNQEKVHRFQAYMKPPELVAQLEEGLRRYDLYKSGKEWDEPTPRPEKITDAADVTILNAPVNKVPAGVVFLNGDLWVGYMGKLYDLDAKTLAVKHEFDNGGEAMVLDITTDGKVLYGVEGGWTVGPPIHVIDPATGKTTRTIVTEANKNLKVGYGAKGITWLNGKLYVLDGAYGKIYEVDPMTGEISKTIATKERYVTGLSHDGKHFVFGSRTDLILVDANTGETRRKLHVNYPLRSVQFHDGAYYVMEQPVFGFSKDHKSIQIWPRESRIYKIVLPPEPAKVAPGK